MFFIKAHIAKGLRSVQWRTRFTYFWFTRWGHKF